MKFHIRSNNAADPTLIRHEIVDLPTDNSIGASREYNQANPGRTARSSGAVLPGTPDSALQRVRYERNGHWVDETD